MTHFVECKREGGGTVLLHIDDIGGIVETTSGKGDAAKNNLMVVLNSGAHFNLIDETRKSLLNKMAQCPRGKAAVIDKAVYEGEDAGQDANPEVGSDGP